MQKKNIIWLASYPKSGNTWFRSFLSSLLNEKDLDINELEEGKIFSRRNVIEEVMDIDTTLFSYDEIKAKQADVYRYLSNKSDEKIFYKIHDGFVKDINNKNIVPENATLCAIYFVRNPLDVVISFANHNAMDFDATINIMENEEHMLGKISGKQIRQPLLSWHNHYISWVKKPNFPVYILKYEEMLSNTFEIFKNIIKKIGLDYTDEAIQAAINATSFEKLKKQEEDKGFNEKNPDSPRFFNNGTSGTWKGKLSEKQIERIVTKHGDVMRDLGYL